MYMRRLRVGRILEVWLSNLDPDHGLVVCAVIAVIRFGRIHAFLPLPVWISGHLLLVPFANNIKKVRKTKMWVKSCVLSNFSSWQSIFLQSIPGPPRSGTIETWRGPWQGMGGRRRGAGPWRVRNVPLTFPRQRYDMFLKVCNTRQGQGLLLVPNAFKTALGNKWIVDTYLPDNPGGAPCHPHRGRFPSQMHWLARSDAPPVPGTIT
jgi:hypothetical protein